MKTFTRLTYGGPQLPATARIARIVPSDGDDLNAAPLETLATLLRDGVVGPKPHIG